MTTAISARHIYKRFVQRRQVHALHGIINRVILSPVTRKPGTNGHGSGEKRFALQDVTFDVPRGDCVGLIGHNGAGKSVLLRILSNVTRPTTGEADLYGSVGAVLDVGVGFNRELTGLENIYLQGAILGIKKRELAKKLDAIIELSGMQDFLDDPLKTYSNGMQVRVAFAVAAQLEPDILLMDEVLAVADEDFIRVCVDKLNELKRDGRTIMIASHDLSLLSQVCNRALWLERGKIVGYGDMEEIAANYHAHVLAQPGNPWAPVRHRSR
jgi:ABC-type polysaccharide/polyol phosphate transport system ATPase subunit